MTEKLQSFIAGQWRDAFTGEVVTLNGFVPLEMKGWRYRVLVAE